MGKFLILFFVFTTSAFAAEDPNQLLIEFADRVMVARTCADCPDFVGQMIGANPITLGQIKVKSDIVVEDCHFTLVGKDTVRTASHCLRRWSNSWSATANGDCSKAYRFYFPETKSRPRETANCAEIISPISKKSGLIQMEPDDVLVRLDHAVDREAAAVDPTPIRADSAVTIWGYDGVHEQFEKRTCHRVKASLLTAFDEVEGSAYATLTCDGDLSTGWSGDGVFVGGRLVGVISFGLGQTTFGVSYFGENEVAVSQASCSFSGGGPLKPACLPSAQELDLALHDRYASAIDLAQSWHQDTIALIKNRFPYVELEFEHGPQLYPLFSYTPRYRVKCYHPQLLPSEGRLLTGIDFNMDTFLPRYVIFAADTTVAGVSRRAGGVQEGPVEFNIGLQFQWSESRDAAIANCTP